ncbi:flavo protein [Pyrenochaeta sp. DS3sAY3a]|nr:flavo protein [Pyrenochaeta sp. DS3sAY3a]
MSATVNGLTPLAIQPVQHQHHPSIPTLPSPLPLDLHDATIHLLLCASGSVATIKIPNIVAALAKHTNLRIRLVFTAAAATFLQGQSAEQPTIASLAALPNVDGVYFDADEWTEPWVRGNTILHIELRRWADIMLIAPLSANALAKMVHGFSDTLLLSVVRAWDTTGVIDPVREIPGANIQWAIDEQGVRRKRILVAPSMNTAMWMQPVTRQQVEVLSGEWGVGKGGWVEVLAPMEKELACGDVGGGAMMDWRGIVGVVEERLGLGGESLKGES